MVTPGKYRHFKNKDYEVLCVAFDEVTEEPLVVYKGPRFFKIVELS